MKENMRHEEQTRMSTIQLTQVPEKQSKKYKKDIVIKEITEENL